MSSCQYGEKRVALSRGCHAPNPHKFGKAFARTVIRQGLTNLPFGVNHVSLRGGKLSGHRNIPLLSLWY